MPIPNLQVRASTASPEPSARTGQSRDRRSGPSWVTSPGEAKPHRKAFPGSRQVRGKTRMVDRSVGQATPGCLAAPAYQTVRRCESQTTRELATMADSSGRRNMDSVDLPQPFVKRLCRGFPAQRLSRSCIEGGCHGSNLLGAVRTQISAFREVLTQQPVRVLVGATLPWAVRIAEVDLDARINLETSMLSHLGALIPRQ